MSDCSESKIRDPCVAGGIYKYIWLDTRHYGGKMGFWTITYSPEVTMNYVAGVEKVQTFSDIGQLVAGVRVRSRTTGDTHKAESICIGVLLDVFCQIPAGHPL